jgi:hypothetical protein
MSIDQFKGFLFCSGTGAYLIWKFLRSRKRVRQVEDTATAKTATAALGFSELEGFAWPKESTFKSRGGNELVYYAFNLEKCVSEGTGKNKKKRWKNVFSMKHCPDIYLVDATGLVEVPIATAELEMKPGVVKDWARLAVEEKRFFLNVIGKNHIPSFPPTSSFFGLFSSSFRVIESEIKVGSPLYVLGFLNKSAAVRSASSVVNAGQGFATNLTWDNRQLVKKTGLTSFAKAVFNPETRSLRNLDSVIDRDGDGKKSEQELTAAYTGAAMVALRNSSKPDSIEQEFEVHGAFESTKDQELVVADTHQEQLSKRMSLATYIQLGTGLVFIAMAIYSAFQMWG